MDGIDQSSIIYTAAAVADMEEKADYIALQLRDPRLAETWYQRLRGSIQEELSTFPLKYSPYHAAPWNDRGIRQVTIRNDVILYSVDEASYKVYIRAVCTKGRDLSAHLSEQEPE